MQDRDWVSAEDIATHLNINVTMAMLYISDLEKVNIITRKQETSGSKKIVKFKYAGQKGDSADNIMAKNGSEIPTEKVQMAIRVYIGIYNSMIHKLTEVGGLSTLENIVIGGTDEVANNKAKEIVMYLEKGGNLEGAMETFNKRLPSGGYTAANFGQVKNDFIEILKKMIEALERFMGKLYGQHLTRTSLKPVVQNNKDIIHELDLFAGLPRDYFPAGGT